MCPLVPGNGSWRCGPRGLGANGKRLLSALPQKGRLDRFAPRSASVYRVSHASCRIAAFPQDYACWGVAFCSAWHGADGGPALDATRRSGIWRARLAWLLSRVGAFAWLGTNSSGKPFKEPCAQPLAEQSFCRPRIRSPPWSVPCSLGRGALSSERRDLVIRRGWGAR